MKYRMIIFLHSLAIVSLQFIPDTIIVGAGVPGGGVFTHYSFISDFPHLWGMGILWIPPVSVFSILSLCFSVILLIWNLRWSKTAILSTSISALLFMSISIHIMIINPNTYSFVMVLIFLLLISEILFTFVSMKKKRIP